MERALITITVTVATIVLIIIGTALVVALLLALLHRLPLHRCHLSSQRVFIRLRDIIFSWWIFDDRRIFKFEL